MKEDIFAVSGAMGKALATKAAGKKASVMSELHGGVQTVFSGKSNIFSDSRRKTYDGHGLFMFPETAGLSPEEKEEKEKEHQEQMMELMYMHRTYHNIVQIRQYASRGSKLVCKYGTRTVLLDIREDHGIYMGMLPAMTRMDCRKQNIPDFGSCMCPEESYKDRLPMTVPIHPDGRQACFASYNHYPHICVPLISIQDGWYQTDTEVFIEEANGVAFQALKEDAFLVCQYGGIITISEAANAKEEKENLLYELSEEYLEWLKMAEGNILYPYVNTKDNSEAKALKNVTLGWETTFDKTGRNWDILQEQLGWSEDDIKKIISELYDQGQKYTLESEYVITENDAKELVLKTANSEYIPNLNAAITDYRQQNGKDTVYSQRELEAMFDVSYNGGLSTTKDTGYAYCSYINDPDRIIYYYLRKDKSGAINAVKKYKNTGNQRRINQMYLFFIGYDFWIKMVMS